MKILHISDTHGFHDDFPKDYFNGIDMIIHSGDCSNSSYLQDSVVEVTNFLNWYETIPVKYKILVAGNHDTAIARKAIKKEDMIMRGIAYLENESIQIKGLKIWGSPITPTFGQWSFMKARDKTHEVWDTIPTDTDIVIVHGPPKGIRDLSLDRENNLEMCGDKALAKRMNIVNPQLMCFGHIHNCKGIINQGTSKHYGSRTLFSNGACVDDGRFDKGLTSFGNIIELK
jgi:Icc-related predicted phosphoesterase